MTKKLYLPIFLLLALSMVLSACKAPSIEPSINPKKPAYIAPTLPAGEIVPEVQALFTDLVASLPADQGYGSVEPDALSKELAGTPPFLLDVREGSEVKSSGYIKGTVNIPVREVLTNLDKLPGLNEPIVVLCASGHRSGMVMAALRLLGYANVRNLNGGIAAWKLKAKLPVERDSMPATPTAISSTPVIADQALYDTLNGLLSTLPEGFYSLKADKLDENLSASYPPALIDVRTREEWDKNGHIKGSINIPFSTFFANLDQVSDKEAHYIIVDDTGHRGSILTLVLRVMGYIHVSNLNGGLNDWVAAKLPVVK
jgi:rhodanese-related sulfurtransferase